MDQHSVAATATIPTVASGSCRSPWPTRAGSGCALKPRVAPNAIATVSTGTAALPILSSTSLGTVTTSAPDPQRDEIRNPTAGLRFNGISKQIQGRDRGAIRTIHTAQSIDASRARRPVLPLTTLLTGGGGGHRPRMFQRRNNRVVGQHADLTHLIRRCELDGPRHDRQPWLFVVHEQELASWSKHQRVDLQDLSCKPHNLFVNRVDLRGLWCGRYLSQDCSRHSKRLEIGASGRNGDFLIHVNPRLSYRESKFRQERSLWQYPKW